MAEIIERIKINELQQLLGSNVSNSNLMVIQDNEDTKKITIKDLKEVFSNSSKLDALEAKLMEYMNEMKASIDEEISEIKKEQISMNSTLSNIQKSMDSVTKTVDKLDDKVTEFGSTVESLSAKVDSLNSDVEALTENVTNVDGKLDDINSDITAMKKSIALNTEEIEGHSTTLDNIKETLKTLQTTVDGLTTDMGNVDTDISAAIEKLRIEIMKYIEYYHHVDEDPPNWDDPGSMDYATVKEMVNTLFPVGSIITTTLKDNPSRYISGTTWENITGEDFEDGDDINSTDPDTISVYIWKRTL